MTKYAVISTDSSSEYYSLIPIVAYSWHKLGYEVVVVEVNLQLDVQSVLNKYCPIGTNHLSIGSMTGVKDSTVAQIARLFAAPCNAYGYDTVITGDGDMIVMKDIFTNSGNVESYGFDLTGKTELPICYLSANHSNWIDLLKIETTNVKSEILNRMPAKAFSNEWSDYWSVDQQLLTQCAIEYGFDKINFYDRGQERSGLAVGRWDRADWTNPPSKIIDVHCIRGLHRWSEITAAVNYLFPEIDWIDEFYNEIIKLQP